MIVPTYFERVFRFGEWSLIKFKSLQPLTRSVRSGHTDLSHRQAQVWLMIGEQAGEPFELLDRVVGLR